MSHNWVKHKTSDFYRNNSDNISIKAKIVKDLDELHNAVYIDGQLGEFGKLIETHPVILEHKPVSEYGTVWIAKLSTNVYAWIKPVYGGTYDICLPLFKVSMK